MSLATDILKRSGLDISPKPAKQVHTPAFVSRLSKEPRKAKTKRKRLAGKPERPFTPPGVSWSCESWQNNDGSITHRGGFRAYVRENGVTINLGEFATAERAHIAYRLYRLWLRRGFTEAPAKPLKRQYIRR